MIDSASWGTWGKCCRCKCNTQGLGCKTTARNIQFASVVNYFASKNLHILYFDMCIWKRHWPQQQQPTTTMYSCM